MEKILQLVKEVNNRGRFKPTWKSLLEFQVPKWFRDAKFGIFVHYGLYSVPEFGNEWYSRNMYQQGCPEFEYHIQTYGEQKDFGYKDFIPMFTGENFDADEWVKLFKESGAKYCCPVAEHHDGFQMYKSEISKWNIAEMGMKKDYLKLLKLSCEKYGLDFCTSSHRAEHWFFMNGGTKFESDIKKEELKKGNLYWPSEEEKEHFDFYSKPYPTKEFVEDWFVRTAELIENYMPKILYFDWWIQHQAFKPYLKELMAFYYNRGLEKGVEVAICYKHDAFLFGTGIVEMERGKFIDAKPFYWQSDTAIGKNSWCYTKNLDYKSSYDLIVNLIDIVSKNGNLLLNVGPRGSGEISNKDREILMDIGKWLKINGEAIYGSKVYSTSGEGVKTKTEGNFSEKDDIVYSKSDFRFTVNNGAIYATVLKYDEDILIKTLRRGSEKDKHGVLSKINNISVLGFEDADISYEHKETGLKIVTKGITTSMPVIFKIEVE